MENSVTLASNRLGDLHVKADFHDITAVGGILNVYGRGAEI